MAIKKTGENSDPTLFYPCGQCGKTDKKVFPCAKGCMVQYCSPQCESRAWPSHRLVCVAKPIEVKTPDQTGPQSLVQQAIIQAKSCVAVENQNTPLHKAASETTHDWIAPVIEQLLLEVDVNARNRDGNTALHLAVKSKNEKAVYALLKSPNIDIKIKDNAGFPPDFYVDSSRNFQPVDERMFYSLNLHRAAQDNKLDILRELFEVYGVPANVRDQAGYTPLHHAASKEVAQLLLKQPGIDLNDRGTNVGGEQKTPLHKAVLQGRYDVVSLFLEQPTIEINARDDRGQTPLHNSWLWHEGVPEMIALLLAKGSSVNAQDNKGETTLHHCLHMGSKAAIVALLEAPDIDLTIKGPYHRPSDVISSKVDPDFDLSKLPYLVTPLEYMKPGRNWAVRSDQAEIYQLLLNRQAS